MKCPKCGFECADSEKECLSCGIVFEKYFRMAEDRQHLEESSGCSVADAPRSYFRQVFLNVPDYGHPFFVAGRGAVLLIILIWGLYFISHPLSPELFSGSFMHLVNLPFHEAGHIIFKPFGAVVTSLGGSLGQILMPLVCMAVFLLKTRDTFAASVALWWTGQNFMDIAPYIADARALVLPLLGGNTGRTAPYGFHDWEFILKETGLIEYDIIIAKTSFFTGALLMLISFTWGGWVLFRQYRAMKETRDSNA